MSLSSGLQERMTNRLLSLTLILNVVELSFNYLFFLIIPFQIYERTSGHSYINFKFSLM